MSHESASPALVAEVASLDEINLDTTEALSDAGGDSFFGDSFSGIASGPQKILLLRPKRPLGANMYDFGSQVEVQNRSKIVTFSDPRANLS